MRLSLGLGITGGAVGLPGMGGAGGYNPAARTDNVDYFYAASIAGADGDPVTGVTGVKGAVLTPITPTVYPALSKDPKLFKGNASVVIGNGQHSTTRNGIGIAGSTWPALQNAPMTVAAVVWPLDNTVSGLVWGRGGRNELGGTPTTSGRGANSDGTGNSWSNGAQSLVSSAVYNPPYDDGTNHHRAVPIRTDTWNLCKPVILVYATNGNTASGQGYEAIWVDGVKVAEATGVTLLPETSLGWELGGSEADSFACRAEEWGVYGSQWTQDDVNAYTAYALAKTSSSLRMIAIGDSLFNGYQQQFDEAEWWRSVQAAMPDAAFYNGGVNGKTMTDEHVVNAAQDPPFDYGNGFSLDGMETMAPAWDGYPQWVVFIGGPFNDVHYANGGYPLSDEAHIIAAETYMIDTVIANGGIPILCIMPHFDETLFGGVGSTALLDTHNAWRLARLADGTVKAAIRWDLMPGAMATPPTQCSGGSHINGFTEDGIHPSERQSPFQSDAVLIALKIALAGLPCAVNVPAVAIPAAPTSLSATAGNGQVALSWTAPSGNVFYNIYRSTSALGPFTQVVIPNGVYVNSYTDTGLTNGTTYYYQVSAASMAGEGVQSTSANAIPVLPIPATPTGLATVGGNAEVSLSWNPATYATGYHIWRSATSGGIYAIVGSPAGTTYTDTGLTNGTTYYYQVSALNGSGESAESSDVSGEPVVTLTNGIQHYLNNMATDAVAADNLTLNNSASYANNGPASVQALNLTTASNDYAAFGSEIVLTNAADWAWTMFVESNDTYALFLSGGAGGNTSDQVFLYHAGPGSDTLFFRDSAGNQTGIALTGWTQGALHHLTLEWNHTSTVLSVYIDNVLAGSGTVTGNLRVDRIGAYSTSGTISGLFTGSMALLGQHNRQYSSAERTELFGAGNGAEYPGF